MYKVKMPKIFRPFECNMLTRLGKDNDGGYLVNIDDVHKSEILVSFGAGPDISFEKDFYAQTKSPIYVYDVNPYETDDFFINDKFFFQQKIDETNINSILENKKNVFFKCDIDGMEYKILNTLVLYSKIFTGMVIEFHDINNHDNFDLLTEFISKISKKLVHIHVNNYFYYKTHTNNIPDTLELTFSSNKNIPFNPNIKLPNLLDMPNNPRDFDFELTF